MEDATWEPFENIEAGKVCPFNIRNLVQMLCLILSNSEFDDPDPLEPHC